ncbi:uncharacterized protein [Palaemon carinicauda]|uniref:uncharacterized protein n=1 Tax=Palaemon carinicauda TaxID=392227 RepID=UPI0035B61B4D
MNSDSCNYCVIYGKASPREFISYMYEETIILIKPLNISLYKEFLKDCLQNANNNSFSDSLVNTKNYRASSGLEPKFGRLLDNDAVINAVEGSSENWEKMAGIEREIERLGVKKGKHMINSERTERGERVEHELTEERMDERKVQTTSHWELDDDCLLSFFKDSIKQLKKLRENERKEGQEREEIERRKINLEETKVKGHKILGYISVVKKVMEMLNGMLSDHSRAKDRKIKKYKEKCKELKMKLRLKRQSNKRKRIRKEKREEREKRDKMRKNEKNKKAKKQIEKDRIIKEKERKIKEKEKEIEKRVRLKEKERKRERIVIEKEKRKMKRKRREELAWIRKLEKEVNRRMKEEKRIEMKEMKKEQKEEVREEKAKLKKQEIEKLKQKKREGDLAWLNELEKEVKRRLKEEKRIEMKEKKEKKNRKKGRKGKTEGTRKRGKNKKRKG